MFFFFCNKLFDDGMNFYTSEVCKVEISDN